MDGAGRGLAGPGGRPLLIQREAGPPVEVAGRGTGHGVRFLGAPAAGPPPPVSAPVLPLKKAVCKSGLAVCATAGSLLLSLK